MSTCFATGRPGRRWRRSSSSSANQRPACLGPTGRPAHHRRRLYECSYHRRSDLHPRLRHPARRGRRVCADDGERAGICQIVRSTSVASGRAVRRPLVGHGVELDEIMAGGRVAAERLWESSGLTHGDIDLPQLYDGFSPLVYFWLEVLGYCPTGEAHHFVQDGAISTGPGSRSPLAVAPSATVASMAFPRCWSVTSNCHGVPANANSTSTSASPVTPRPISEERSSTPPNRRRDPVARARG